MTHEDNHVVRVTPDDEDIEFELNLELGNREQRMINERVRWARERREEAEQAAE